MVSRKFRTFFGSVVELRNATNSFFISVCSEHLGVDFHEILHLDIFRKSFERMQVLLQYKNSCHFTWRHVNRYDNISLHSSQYEKYFKCCGGYPNTHFMFSKSFPKYKKKKKNGYAEQATDGNIIRRMSIECWLIKATDTHIEYEILIAFLLQQWLR